MYGVRKREGREGGEEGEWGGTECGYAVFYRVEGVCCAVRAVGFAVDAIVCRRCG